MCGFLVEKGYGRNFVEQQVYRERRIPRNEALREKPKKDNNRISFTVTYHPGLPNIGGLLRELQPVLHSSISCKDAIKQFLMVAFRKPKSFSEYLVRASCGSKDEVKGTSKCNSNRCQICTRRASRKPEAAP